MFAKSWYYFLKKFAGRMAFKDHYKTLGVAVNATESDIKKKFRKLALRYHPDRNAESDFAAVHFREIQEAYEILTDPALRYRYDREWRLHFPGQSDHYVRTYTPESILDESIALNKQVKGMDIYRMNTETVMRQVKKILSEENVQLLLFHKNEPVNQNIIIELQSVASRLHHSQIPFISALLQKLADNNEKLSEQIVEWQQRLIRKSYWERYYPFIAIAIAVLICVMIYMLSR